MLTDVREYIDRLHIEGHTVGEDRDDYPLLIGPDGPAVDTAARCPDLGPGVKVTPSAETLDT